MMKHLFAHEKTELYTHVLAAVTLLLGAVCFLRVAGFLAACSEVRAATARVSSNVRQGGTPDDLNTLLASGKACAEELKKKNLFVVTPARQHPVNEVLGILGDEVLINENWYKVGASVGDAKIVAIEATKVKIAWDGQEKDFSPITSSGGGRQEGPSRPPRPTDKPRPAGRGGMVAANARGGPTPGGRAGPAGLSEDERAKMRQQWQNMTPEERQQARQQTRQRLGSRTR